MERFLQFFFTKNVNGTTLEEAIQLIASSTLDSPALHPLQGQHCKTACYWSKVNVTAVRDGVVSTRPLFLWKTITIFK